MTRRLAQPTPVTVRCRHCGGAHSIANCPAVRAAFGPVKASAQKPHPPARASVRANQIRPRQAAHSKPARRVERPPAHSKGVLSYQFAVIPCAHCGQPLTRTVGRQKYHPECYAAVNRADNRQRAAARRAALPPRPATLRPCARCGQVVERKANNQKYCTVCAADVMRERSRAANRARRAQQNSQ